MSDEDTSVEGEDTDLKNESDAAPEPTKIVEESEVEISAREMGWRPEEEYQGDTPWVDAKEFVERKPLYDGLSSQSKQLKKLKSEMAALTEHNRKIAGIQYEKAKRELKAERLDAMKGGEFERAEQLSEQERELDKEAKEAATAAPDVPIEFIEWQESNGWYNTDQELRRFADIAGQMIRDENPEMLGKALYEEVTRQTKKAFSDKFKKPIPNGGSAPTGGSNRGTKGATALLNKLTDVEKQVGTGLVRSGAFKNLNEYAEQLDLDNR
jgi:hypothetical protein|tara:strand:+ start:662 stop:1465 length:804 start_codon:yes stop_codon:yes gene_type:complete